MHTISLSLRQRNILGVSVGDTVVFHYDQRQPIVVTSDDYDAFGEAPDTFDVSTSEYHIARVDSSPDSGVTLYDLEARSVALLGPAAYRRAPTATATGSHVVIGVLGQEAMAPRARSNSGSGLDDSGRIYVELRRATDAMSRGTKIETNSSYIAQHGDNLSDTMGMRIITILDSADSAVAGIANAINEARENTEREYAANARAEADRQRAEQRVRRAAERARLATLRRRDNRVSRRTSADIGTPMPVGTWATGEDEGDASWYDVADRNTSSRRSTL